MPRLAPNQVPSYRLHSRSGKAMVTLCGRDFTLGVFGTPESRKRYHELIAKWEANGRRPLHLAPEELRPAALDRPLTIDELCAAFLLHADGHYRKHGKPTSEVTNFKLVTAVLREAFASLPAREFSPNKLREVRSRMVKRGWVRKSINTQVGRIRTIFSWAVGQEMLPESVHATLRHVEPLEKGRSSASESKPVPPVPDAYVDALQGRVPSAVWAMIQVQRFTGMRPGEVAMMRAIEIDRSGDVWTYTPADHKTIHHDHKRIVCLGPRAQAAIAPFMTPDRPLHAYLFDPREAIAEARASKATKGKRRRTAQKPNARKTTRRVADHYTTSSYRRAIHNACDIEPSVPRWSPHRLRHNFGTEVRRQYGAEAAQIALGHASMNTTEIYAERDLGRMKTVAAKLG